MKRCKGCREWFNHDDYAIARYRVDGTPIRRTRCTPCLSKQRQEWRERNRERDRANTNRWQRAEYAKDGEWTGLRRAANRERHSGSPMYMRETVTGRVPTSILREVVERSDLPATVISLAAGYTESTVYKAMQRDEMSAEMAVRVLGALDVLPAEVGL